MEGASVQERPGWQLPGGARSDPAKRNPRGRHDRTAVYISVGDLFLEIASRESNGPMEWLLGVIKALPCQ